MPPALRVPFPRLRGSVLRQLAQARRGAGGLPGASTQPHDTPAIRSHAAIVCWARTRGRRPRSVSVSNATDRILRDDPAWLKGWGATQASRLALGHPLPTSVEGSGLRVQRPSEARRSLTVKPLMSGFTLANNSRNLVARGVAARCVALPRPADRSLKIIRISAVSCGLDRLPRNCSKSGGGGIQDLAGVAIHEVEAEQCRPLAETTEHASTLLQVVRVCTGIAVDEFSLQCAIDQDSEFAGGRGNRLGFANTRG
jgi:hypothetical protein